MTAPVILRGAVAIGEHLGIRPRVASHLDKQRHIPTFRVPGDSAPFATVAGLDDWLAIPDEARVMADKG